MQVRYVNLWTPPETITPQVVDLAKAALPAWEALLQPPPAGPVEREGTRGHWLAQLMMLTMTAKGTVEMHQERLAIMAAGLLHPAFCFTRWTLFDAARQFKFFPTFGELSAFLDAVAEPARRQRARLTVLAKADMKRIATQTTGTKIGFVRDLPPAEREKFLRDMAEMRRRLACAGVGATPVAAAARRSLDAVNERMRQRIAQFAEAGAEEKPDQDPASP